MARYVGKMHMPHDQRDVNHSRHSLKFVFRREGCFLLLPDMGDIPTQLVFSPVATHLTGEHRLFCLPIGQTWEISVIFFIYMRLEIYPDEVYIPNST